MMDPSMFGITETKNIEVTEEIEITKIESKPEPKRWQKSMYGWLADGTLVVRQTAGFDEILQETVEVKLPPELAQRLLEHNHATGAVQTFI